ncbi:MAG: filamentous hemagglutinin N-terminal domain-containing protein, partial [Betaproteobacteria bacterium]|nr:filamentous hemagglutinin N-terminal domain-containing protein [Betaproteobacteria bacterium]
MTKPSLTLKLLLGLTSMLTVSAYAAPAVNALPQGGVVSAGSAVISQSVGSNSAALTVNQSSQRAVIDWNSYNVGQNATVTYNQPNSQSSTLNRISDPNVSQIFGQIKSNGEVVLVNPEGVYFSPSSSVNVGALVATTNNISNSDYMNGKATYTRGNASGSVVNEGNITAGLGRYVALLAPSVRNSGIIIAQMGTAVLASGDVITLNFNSGNHLAS